MASSEAAVAGEVEWEAHKDVVLTAVHLEVAEVHVDRIP